MISKIPFYSSGCYDMGHHQVVVCWGMQWCTIWGSAAHYGLEVPLVYSWLASNRTAEGKKHLERCFATKLLAVATVVYKHYSGHLMWGYLVHYNVMQSYLLVNTLTVHILTTKQLQRNNIIYCRRARRGGGCTHEHAPNFEGLTDYNHVLWQRRWTGRIVTAVRLEKDRVALTKFELERDSFLATHFSVVRPTDYMIRHASS